MSDNKSVKTAVRRPAWIYMLIFAAAAVFVFSLEYRGDLIAGTDEDWINQHTAYADYFRRHFYQTHNLFPQFASELGGGQNIWYFAYYGLYNPLYLLSFLFPFISMETWFQIIGVLTHAADGILCFFWLRRHTGDGESLFGALMLMFSFAIVGQTISQVMFVEYMPFLLMMLLGADRRRETGSGVLMAVGTLCMILNSFYFSPACLAVLVIYILYLESASGCRPIGKYLKKCFKMFIPAVTGIILSAFYLGPILFAVLQGRSSGGKGTDPVGLSYLFTPDVSLHRFLYSDYGLGLTAMSLIMLTSWIFAKRSREKRLSIAVCIIILFPVFAWVLNGGLYARSKAYIPFLPLICLLCALFIERIGSAQLKWRCAAAGYGLTLIYVYVNRKKELLLYDAVLCGLILVITWLVRHRAAAAAATAAMMIFVCVVQTQSNADGQVTKEFVNQLHDADTEQTVSSLLAQDSSCRMEVRGETVYENANENRIYAAGQNLTTCYSSLSNQTYDDLRLSLGLARSARNVFMQDIQNDPLFLRFMGVKYLIGGDGVYGWTEKAGAGQTVYYENDSVSPLFYLTDQTMSSDQLAEMSWQEKQIALLEAAAVPDGQEIETPELRTQTVTIAGSDSDDGSLTMDGQTVHVKSDHEIKTTLLIDQGTQEGEYVFLSFRINNHQDEDVSIVISGEQNLLSSSDARYYNNNEVFHYVLPAAEGTNGFTITFGEGDYDIEEIECTTGSVDEAANQSLYQSEADLSLMKDGDGYSGTVTAQDGQWLITTLPYEESFKVTIDGQEVETEEVNGGFLGFQVPAGTHDIVIRYTAPGSRAGAAVSAAMLVLWAVTAVRQRKRSR